MPRGRARPALALVIAAVLAPWAAVAGASALSATEAFVARLGDLRVTDLVVRQTVTMYHPDGRRPRGTAAQQLFVKVPGRQRLEETIEGGREVTLVIDGRTWVRDRDGTTHEAPPTVANRDATRFLTPFRRSAGDLLAEWRAHGVRDDLSRETVLKGRRVTIIGAPAGDRASPAVWLDGEYGVVRFIARERLPQGPALLDLTFSEHRRVSGGFFFPFRQEAFVDGRLILLVTVRSVELNTNVPDELFDPARLGRER